MPRAWLVASIAVCALLPATAAAAPTTVRTTANPISALAHDGNRIAWLTSRTADYATECIQLRVRRLVRAREALLRRTCAPTQIPHLLALAGRRVLWGEEQGGSTYQEWVYTAALDDRRARYLTEFQGIDGDHFPFAIFTGDGTLLAYAWARTAIVMGDSEDEPECWQDADVPCLYRVTGGAAWRVVDGRKIRIPAVPPPFAFAASAGRIAVVPADRTESQAWRPRPVAGGPVEIRDAETGALTATFAPAGTVRALALAGRSAAVLVGGADGTRIERYDSRTGTLVGATTVPPETAAALDVHGSRVVYRVGRSIRLFDGAGTTSRLWASRRTPLGLSIEGRRVLWATNGRRGGRIFALTIARS
jgi:hypothetical protein